MVLRCSLKNLKKPFKNIDGFKFMDAIAKEFNIDDGDRYNFVTLQRQSILIRLPNGVCFFKDMNKSLKKLGLKAERIDIESDDGSCSCCNTQYLEIKANVVKIPKKYKEVI